MSTTTDSSCTNEKFDLNVVHVNLLTSLCGDGDDVDLVKYIDGYRELHKFCQLMGAVFSFVSSDLKSKIDILTAHVDNDVTSKHFQTVKRMIEYEKAEGLLVKKHYVSGSRTLLRLHRGLDFIRMFLRRVYELQNPDKTSQVCSESYDATLSRFHPWLIRKGAKVAMYTMPTREQLLRKVSGDTDAEFAATVKALPQMLDAIADVYGRVEKLYALHDLHALP